MSYFTQLENLPIYDLYSELEIMLKLNIISWKHNQICLNTTEQDPDNIHLGVGSLWYDWDNAITHIDKLGMETVEVPEKKIKLKETDFTIIANPFKRTLFEEIYNSLCKNYVVGRVRIMKSEPKTCLSWHVDDTKRIHYPLKTQDGCIMVIENEVKHMPSNTWWLTDTQNLHTAFNASTESRIHLVVEVVSQR